MTGPRETPVSVPCGGDHVFGILTEPAGEPNGAVAVLLWGGGQMPSYGRNQVCARLCRRLGEAGYHAVRADYRGFGDSTGAPPRLRMDDVALEPLVEGTLAVLGWLARHGLSRVVPVGSCLGARVALECMPSIPDLAGLVLLAAPAGDYEYRRLRPVGGPTSGFVAQLTEVVERRLPTLLLYGEQDVFYQDFARARAARLGELLAASSDLLTVEVIAGGVHADPTVANQRAVIDRTCDWLAARGVS